MEDLGEDTPKKFVFNVLTDNCRCCNKTVSVRNHPVAIFGKKSKKELLDVLQFLTGKEVKCDDGLPKKLCQPCFRKVKSIIEFRALSMSTLSSQESLIGETRMKRVRGSQQVGESPSSSQLAKKTSLNRENIEDESIPHRVRMCLFVEGDQMHHKNVSQFRPIAPKNNTNATRRLPEFLQGDKERHDATKEKEIQVSESPAVLSIQADIMRQSGLRKYQVCEILLLLLQFLFIKSTISLFVTLLLLSFFLFIKS